MLQGQVEGHRDLRIDLTEEVLGSVGQHFGDGGRVLAALRRQVAGCAARADWDWPMKEAMKMPYPL